jgi:hypothetical protein
MDGSFARARNLRSNFFQLDDAGGRIVPALLLVDFG